MTARWMAACLLAAAVSAADDVAPPCDWCVDYPIALPAEPDFFASGTPFKLVDFRYHLTDTTGSPANHDLVARFRVRDWAYVGTQLDGDRKTLTIETHRFDLRVSDLGREWDLFGGYRGPRLSASLDAFRRPFATLPTVAPGWLFRPALGLRVARDLTASAAVAADTATPYDHALRSLQAGLLWQPSARAEVRGEFEHARDANNTPYENTRNTGAVAVIAQVGPTEVSADGQLDDVKGRFPRTDFLSTLGLRIPLTPRLLVEGSGQTRFESQLLAHDYRGAVTWYGRRFYLPRLGRSAERSVALARHATAVGENEVQLFDDESRRLQRERLSLSPRGRELTAEMTDLYHAQVQERAVPLLAFEFRDRDDRVNAEKRQTLAASLGIPWPLALPWRASDVAVPFLTLDLARERVVTRPDFVAITHSASLSATLNREMDLVLRWRHAEPTPLDLERRIGARTTLEVGYVYAFGR
jgi:hypothetical protein